MIGGRKESDRLEHSLICKSGDRKVNGNYVLRNAAEEDGIAAAKNI